MVFHGHPRRQVLHIVDKTPSLHASSCSKPGVISNLTSNPVVFSLVKSDFKLPKWHPIDKIGRVELVPVPAQVAPGIELMLQVNAGVLAGVAFEHQKSPQQAGQRPFLCRGLHLSFVSPQMRADSGAMWSSSVTMGSPCVAVEACLSKH